MKHWKTLVESFDKIEAVKLQGTTVTVQGTKNSKAAKEKATYKHEKVAQKVLDKVSNFIGVGK